MKGSTDDSLKQMNPEPPQDMLLWLFQNTGDKEKTIQTHIIIEIRTGIFLKSQVAILSFGMKGGRPSKFWGKSIYDQMIKKRETINICTTAAIRKYHRLGGLNKRN